MSNNDYISNPKYDYFADFGFNEAYVKRIQNAAVRLYGAIRFDLRMLSRVIEEEGKDVCMDALSKYPRDDFGTTFLSHCTDIDRLRFALEKLDLVVDESYINYILGYGYRRHVEDCFVYIYQNKLYSDLLTEEHLFDAACSARRTAFVSMMLRENPELYNAKGKRGGVYCLDRYFHESTLHRSMSHDMTYYDKIFSPGQYNIIEKAMERLDAYKKANYERKELNNMFNTHQEPIAITKRRL